MKEKVNCARRTFPDFKKLNNISKTNLKNNQISNENIIRKYNYNFN